jgi:hypothetical protein
MIINTPVPYPGTDEEKTLNRASHVWLSGDSDTRCINCDCKPWHIHADYPCGDEAPRMDIEINEAASPFRFID